MLTASLTPRKHEGPPLSRAAPVWCAWVQSLRPMKFSSVIVFVAVTLSCSAFAISIDFGVFEARRPTKGPGTFAPNPRNSAILWAHQVSNLGPLPCEGSALPLSYAPYSAVKSAGLLPPAPETVNDYDAAIGAA